MAQPEMDPTGNGVEEDDDWENEDPNLLNVPELLYKEVANLPLPHQTRQKELEMDAAMKIVRELMLESNTCLESISKRGELLASEEQATAVVDYFVQFLSEKIKKLMENRLSLDNQPMWDNDIHSQLFSTLSSEKVSVWNASLNNLLGSYHKIRNCIPKEAFDAAAENSKDVESEREQCNYLPDIVRALEEFLDVMHTFTEQ